MLNQLNFTKLKKTIQILIVLPTIAVLLSLVSCTKKSSSYEDKLLASDDLDVVCIKGILHFSSGESFYKVVNQLILMNENERKAWEQRLGFKSQYSLVDEVFSELENVTTKEAMTDILDRNNDILLINSNNEIIPKVSTDQYARIINRQGYFYVGRILHKATDDFIYIAKIEGENELDSYLKEGEKSNKIFIVSYRADQNTKLDYGSNQEATYIDDNRMVKMYMTTYKSVTWDGYYWYCHDYVAWTIKGFKKILGIWNSYKTLYTYKDVSFVVKAMYDVYYEDYDYHMEEPLYVNLGGNYPGPVSTTVESKSITWIVPIGDAIQSSYVHYPDSLDAPYFVSVSGKSQSRGTESGWAIIYCP